MIQYMPTTIFLLSAMTTALNALEIQTPDPATSSNEKEVVATDKKAQEIYERYMSVIDTVNNIEFASVATHENSFNLDKQKSILQIVIEYANGNNKVLPFHRMAVDRMEEKNVIGRIVHDGQRTARIDHLKRSFLQTQEGAELLLTKAAVVHLMGNDKALSFFCARIPGTKKVDGIWNLVGQENINGELCDVIHLQIENIKGGGKSSDEKEAQPKDGDKKSSITIACARTDGFLRRIEFKEHLIIDSGDDQRKGQINFSCSLTSVKINGQLDDNVFRIERPQDYVEISNKARDSRVKVGDPAPDFNLRDQHGQDVSLVSLKGKVVLLDFWATWCGPCIRAMPIIHTIAQDYRGKEFVALGVNVFEKSGEGAVLEFLKTNEHAPRSLLKGDELYNSYGITGIPAIVIIGRDGKVAFIGNVSDPLRPIIDKELGK